ncbi:hypothetical protein B0T16DRAFT_461447 [Cercophora newfieldiana]|uniref:Uncharacterized protein n=1 Tax=Cercophora newfieldiana TaxID=92897 RepID=A0AA40CLG8_9PEZI|nr:hypothetical protein B0T16DRAFT_461447 [Cercophora newfieldiana]
MCRETWFRTTLDVPCGVKVPTQKVNVCNAARSALGDGGKQAITKVGAMCHCLPKALEMYGKKVWRSVAEGKEISAAVSSVIGDSMQLQKCMVDNGFHVQDNKALLVTKGDLSPAGGWTVFQAAEIDLISYSELTAAVAPCAAGDSGCEPTRVDNFFTKYLAKSRDLMSNGLVATFKGWIDTFTDIETKVRNVGDAAAHFVGLLNGVSNRIDSIQEKKGLREDKTTTPFLDNVSKAISAVQKFQDVRNATMTIAETAPKLVNLTRNAVKVAQAPPNMSQLFEMAAKGDLRNIEDILKTIKAATELPDLVRNLQKAISPTVGFVSFYSGDDGRDAMSSVDAVLADNTAARNSTSNTRAAVAEIQDLLREDVQAPFRNVMDSIRKLEGALDAFPVKEGKFAIESGVASYQRWSTVSMDLPCVRQARMPYNVAGFKGSFGYPEFFPCPYGPETLPWPNHHIPYIKFRAQ